ncbi:PepSY domain-containing protein [Streptococcus sp. sy004]|uniref:PepSY domain-containing protein n=1 Tax=Streptococcus sp. sy004 TaxID=2600149 RepID=UPI0011B6247F|nr:PepSY domain-containing protein [Streptococcus sp. sy004]TWT11264.1 hypothetical protein FRX54_03180 [Streptococcus sp. sy004]
MKKLLVAAVVAILALLGLSTCAGSFLNGSNNNTATTSSSSSASSSEASTSSDKSASSTTSSSSSDKTASSSTDASASTATETLTKDTAFAAALAAAGISEADAVLTSVEKDVENGVNVFKVDFTSAGQEYEYTLNAETGEVIENASEMVDSKDASTSTATVSSADQNKLVAAALADAGITEADAEVVGSELETEDGVQQFDVDFVSNGTRYHYILNAETKEVIETETSPAE